MSAEGSIEVIVIERWVPVTKPVECRCGHTHTGRQLYRNGVPSQVAPQWHLCNDRECGCTSLKRMGGDSMMIDLTTPQAQIAQHYMRTVKGLDIEAFDVERLDDINCWYFYYRLPQGVLELEVFFDRERDDWDVCVTGFPAHA